MSIELKFNCETAAQAHSYLNALDMQDAIDTCYMQCLRPIMKYEDVSEETSAVLERVRENLCHHFEGLRRE